MWNDTDIPLAHLITFRSYGTWLHGDKRGSVDRFHNQYQAPYIRPDKERFEANLDRLSHEIVSLNARQRDSTENAIRETCKVCKWALLAVNVRTNHVHSVVSIGTAKSSRALNAFKAYATRRMRQDGCWLSDRSPWADKGSKRNLWTERSVELAIDYVLNGQGDDLPDFD
ncbi:MAG TPA: transposase [Pyrinomonadaceae bacterium]|jgi:REP element-mobilizing transposase RayT|nr:transposase [Pyrinomonadaceae bacterium]